jgi:hypothetical protein
MFTNQLACDNGQYVNQLVCDNGQCVNQLVCDNGQCVNQLVCDNGQCVGGTKRLLGESGLALTADVQVSDSKAEKYPTPPLRNSPLQQNLCGFYLS